MAILMCRPQHYGVEYEINPWMHMANTVDRRRAREQWEALFRAYHGLGQTVELVEPEPGHPDMVFTANAALVRGGRAVLSNFKYPQRQGEEPFWSKALAARGFELVKLPSGVFFEGAGDALFVGDRLFCGFGFRTDRRAHQLLARALAVEFVSLELVDPRFYHLDTCFCPLGPEVVMFAPEALTAASARNVRRLVPHVIEVPLKLAAGFVCNGVMLDGRLLSSSGVEELDQELRREGFESQGLPMTEFIKSGGGVRCLSLFLD